MDTLYPIFTFTKSNSLEFKKPDAYKNINNSSVIKCLFRL